WLLTGAETGAEQFSEERLRKMQAVREWSLAQLSEADRAFIAAFQPTVTLPLAPQSGLRERNSSSETLRVATTVARSPVQAQLALAPNRNLLCFHGSPASFDDVILPSTSEEEFQKYLGAHAGHLLCGGHTHLQQIRRLGDGFFFNPGSAGLAYSHTQPEGALYVDPWAEYAVLSVEGGRDALEFRKVPFDVNEMIHVYRESGRPFAEDAIAQYSPRA
ncbi:MAG: metallophosphoesterase family protein, partial [Anaerolineales bacterium]